MWPKHALEVTLGWFRHCVCLQAKYSQGCVFSNIVAQDLSMDHHKAQNWATLWTEIDTGGCKPAAVGDTLQCQRPVAMPNVHQ
jgi:hypothetical protein